MPDYDSNPEEEEDDDDLEQNDGCKWMTVDQLPTGKPIFVPFHLLIIIRGPEPVQQ
jgi:hypothetical protein